MCNGPRNRVSSNVFEHAPRLSRLFLAVRAAQNAPNLKMKLSTDIGEVDPNPVVAQDFDISNLCIHQSRSHDFI